MRLTVPRLQAVGALAIAPTRGAARLPLLLATTFLVTVATPEASGKVDPNVVRLVADSIRANYSRVRSAHLTVRSVQRDRDQSVSGERVTRLTSGGVARIRSAPISERHLTLWLSGDSLRLDREDAAQPGNPGETIVRHDGVWMQHAANIQAAWRRRPEDMPALFPIDPREYGAMDARRTLQQVLSEDKILSAGMAVRDDGQTVARIVTQNSRAAKTYYEFAASNSYLPTTVKTRWPDGGLLQLVEIRYRSVLAGQALFPEQRVRRFYPPGASGERRAEAWRQELIEQVTGEIELNQPIPASVFEPTLPVGTRVSDNLRLAVYHVPKAVGDAERGPPVTGLAVVLLAIAVVVKYARRFTLFQPQT